MSGLIFGAWWCQPAGIEAKARTTDRVSPGLKGTAAARETHWALQPVQRSTIPAVRAMPDATWTTASSWPNWRKASFHHRPKRTVAC